MNINIKKFTKVSKGFTLMEMMIVIIILSVFYSIASANVLALQNEARISKANGDLKTLQLALDTYVSNHNICPRKEDYQRLLIRETPNILIGNAIDPFGEKVCTLYDYNTSGNMQYYVIYSIGQHRNGSAVVGNDGRVLVEGTPIVTTNGYL